MLNHEYFQELAALAAIGQLSGPEMTELEDHLEKCASCRTLHADYAGIVWAELPVVRGRRERVSRLQTLFGADRGFRQRFIERARSEGIRFSPEVNPKAMGAKVPFFASASARAACLVLGSLLFAIGVWMYRSKVHSRTVVTAVSALQHEVARLAVSNTDLRAGAAELAKSEALKTARIQQLERELAARHRQLITLELQVERSHEDQLALRAQMGTAKAQAVESESRNQENGRLVRELKKELDRVRASQADTEATVAAQQDRIRELSEKLATETAVSERELLAASKDVRNLMGARNLHIIDVLDVDGRGKTARAFGRVFYTEGKSLIFYAFDLTPRRLSRADHAFQAWGYRDPAPQLARSLGIFYVDDKTENRWLLKFDDPAVLAEIDAVFVTVEPPGGSPKPTGQKLLYAYLKGQPNHP